MGCDRWDYQQSWHWRTGVGGKDAVVKQLWQEVVTVACPPACLPKNIWIFRAKKWVRGGIDAVLRLLREALRRDQLYFGCRIWVNNHLIARYIIFIITSTCRMSELQIPREFVQWETSVCRSSPNLQHSCPASPLLPVIAGTNGTIGVSEQHVNFFFKCQIK